MRPLERKALIDELAAMLLSGELRLGDAVRVLRRAVLGMDRQRFADVVKLSKRAIAVLEDAPDANPTLDTLKKVFAPFGGKLSVVFPSTQEPPGEERAQQRAAILAAVEKTRHRPRGKAPRDLP